MIIWKDWQLSITVDQVLTSQGADPAVIRQRKSALVALAERAIVEFSPLLTPQVALTEYAITGHHHSYLLLQDNLSLHGVGIVSALADADTLYCGLATLGPALEAAVVQWMKIDPALGMAIDGLGNAALDLLQVETCRRLDKLASQTSRYASIPYSPGMIGWDLIESQPQVVDLAPAAEIGVALSDELMLLPQKSISFVIGMSGHPFGQSSMCDVCSLQATCRFRGASAHG